MSDETSEPATEPEAEQQTAEPGAPVAPEQPTDPWADPERARKEIEKLRKESAKYRTSAKELEPLARKAKELEDAQKSETERLTGQLAEAREHAALVQQRAVRAEVRALASADFADPEDAPAFLDLDGYVGEDGEVDADRIRDDLKALLTRKPHLGKPPEGPRTPRPDRAQGSSGNGQRTTNDPGAEFADYMKRALERGH